MLPLAFVSFLAFGYLLVVVGASQAGLTADLGLGLEQFGLLGATLALGVGAGVFTTGPLVDRFARRPLMVGATLLCALGLASVWRESSLASALAGVFAFGVGGGAIDALLNAVVIERYRERAARPLAVLHGAATLGAVLAPGFIGWITQATDDWSSAFRAGAAGFVLLAVWSACIPFAAPAGRAPETASATSENAGAGSWLPRILGLCAVGFAYVGVENGVTLFAVPYTGDALGLGEPQGRRAISAFWLGLLLARAALALYRGRVGPSGLAAMGAAGAVVIAGGVASGWPPPVPWALAVGICLGGVFPLMVTLAGERVPHRVGTATAIVVGTASLGGFVVPWMAGALGERAGVSVAMASLAIVCLALAVAAWSAREPAPGIAPVHRA